MSEPLNKSHRKSKDPKARVSIAADTCVPRLPQKRFFRQRAHSNPFSDHDLTYPLKPKTMDWTNLYPKMPTDSKVEFADVGCGYGGLLVSLSKIYPEKFMLGMEIRVKVSDYVQQRIVALRAQHLALESGKDSENEIKPVGPYQNIAVLRSNAMKFLPNLFEKGQLTKMFFLFPDPHFKKKKHKARIISNTLLAEYAFVLRPGGLLYTVTDVFDLHIWMKEHLAAHTLFEIVKDEELKDDPVIPCVMTRTEEGLKVEREGGEKYLAVFRRVMHPAEAC